MASGLAQGLGSMVVSRALVGLGEASYATLAPTLIDELAPASQKSRWMSIFYSATPIGSALGYMVGGAVYNAHGWRAAFFVAGGPGLVIALLCLLIVEPPRPQVGGVRPPREDRPPEAGSEPYRDREPERPGDRPPSPGGWLDSARQLARVPLYTGTVLGYCAYTFALGGFAYWAPVYLHRQYGTR